MKNIFLIFCFLFFVITLSYADIDFRSSKIKQKRYVHGDFETKIKLSVGIFSELASKAEGYYHFRQEKYEKIYGWQHIGTEEFYGKMNFDSKENNWIYDLSFETHYFIYKFIGLGAGFSVPFKQIYSNYIVNPYLSFKIKNFLDDIKEMDDFYFLLNFGTILRVGQNNNIFSGMKLGFDIGFGYEYKNFVFEVLYSAYSLKNVNYGYYKYNSYYLYTTENHYSYNVYEAYADSFDVDLTRIKLIVGYKFYL